MSDNHFTLLGLPQQYPLDLVLLERHYLAAQQRCHPDVAAGADPLSQLEALHQTADLNTAYDVLKHPVKRAVYLLEAAGVVEPLAQQPLSPADLTQYMDWRTPLMAGGDLTLVRNAVNNAWQQAENGFITAFEKSDLTAASYHATQMQFIDKFNQELRLATRKT